VALRVQTEIMPLRNVFRISGRVFGGPTNKGVIVEDYKNLVLLTWLAEALISVFLLDTYPVDAR
jgi:hypothetical protein